MTTTDDPQLVFQQIRQLKLTQDDVKRIVVEEKSGKMKVIINGELKVLELELPGLSDGENQQFKSLLNKGLARAQEEIMLPITKLTT